jgi:predicted nucleotidyltransferase component of viral defense system
MSTFQPRFEILPPAQIQLWKELQPLNTLGFVLYGGTALALRLGHRVSVDFDFFIEKKLKHAEIKNTLPFLSKATVIQDEPNAFSAIVSYPNFAPGHVKVSFFGDIGFGRVGTPQASEDGIMQVASLDDLMATKLKVILQRAEAKDYGDIAAMINQGVSLSKGLAAAREIFGPNFQPSESLKALTYFEDGDLSSLTQSQKEVLIQAAIAVRDLPIVEIQSKCLTA